MVKKIKEFLLKPLSYLWENIYRLRRALYSYRFISSTSFKVPIISVGNISFGGTGKTPLTSWLVDYISSQEKKAMVLTRGYKGKLEKKSGIIWSNQALLLDPSLYGDEPLIIGRKMGKGAVVVGRDRIENLKKYFSRVEPDIVILDDGHQYLKISRNLNIVLFDSLMDISLYKTAPLGRLREGPRSLSDADIICFTRCDLVSEEKIIELKKLLAHYHKDSVTYLELVYTPLGLFDAHFKTAFLPSEIKGKKIIAVCGLASPQSFFQALDLLGAITVKKVIFKDHHAYSRLEVFNLLDEAKENEAMVITTEKDMIKIRKLVMSEKLLFLGIGIDFRKGESELKTRVDRLLMRLED